MLESRFKHVPAAGYPHQYAFLQAWRTAFHEPEKTVIHYNGPLKPWMSGAAEELPLANYWQNSARNLFSLPNGQAHTPEKPLFRVRELSATFTFLGVPLLKIKDKNGVKKYLAFGHIRIAKRKQNPGNAEISIFGLPLFKWRQEQDKRP